MRTNKLTKTLLIFPKLEKINMLIELHTKISKLNDKKNINIVVKYYKKMILRQK